jgi:hypothetical protein
MHAFGLDHQARVGLEVSVGRERHPMVFEGVGGVLHGVGSIRGKGMVDMLWGGS